MTGASKVGAGAANTGLCNVGAGAADASPGAAGSCAG